MAAKLSARGNNPFPMDTSSKMEREDMSKIQQDINILTQRIAELKGERAPSPHMEIVPAGSNFVTGIRSMTDTERKPMVSGRVAAKESKLSSLETLLEKVAEFDRIILQRTVPEPNPNGVTVRRKSVGLDLHTLPTHLHVTDRLLDLHTQSKRVVVVKTTGQAAPAEPSSSSTASENTSESDRKLLDALRAQVTKLTKEKEDSEAQRLKYVQDCLQLAKENTELKERLAKPVAVQPALVAQPAALPPTPVPVDNSSKELLHFQEQLSKLEQQSAAQANQLRKESSDLKESLARAEQQVADLAAQLTAAKAVAPSSAVVDHSAEVAALREQVKALTVALEQTQIKLEIEVGKYEAVKVTIYNKAQRVGSRRESGLTAEVLNAQECSNLPEDVKAAFFALETAIVGRMEYFRNELALLLSVKEMLEGELSSVNLLRDVLNADHTTLMAEHEALKIAYHELSYETASGNKAKSQAENTLSLQNQLKDANTTVEQLQEELYSLKRAAIELEKLPLSIMKLEQALNLVSEEKSKLETQIMGQTEEIKQYKRLTDTLKDKIKEMGLKHASGAAQTDAKDFLDTFEEVMRDEMLTMKSAFEAKLRAAKESAESTAKRHQQEILRIHSGTPYMKKQGQL